MKYLDHFVNNYTGWAMLIIAIIVFVLFELALWITIRVIKHAWTGGKCTRISGNEARSSDSDPTDLRPPTI